MWVSASSQELFHRLQRDPDNAWRKEVFDLSQDPLALHDIRDGANPKQQTVLAELENYHRTLVAAYLESQDTAVVPPPREEELLRELGYIK